MKKILILEANPDRNLNLNGEIRDLQQVILSSRDRDEFQIDIGLSVRSTDLHGLMLQYEPNIVHFCGHGTGQDGLVFQDKKISTDAISKLFKNCQNHLQCVVLNACYSEVQADEIVKHIKYVIGMNQPIRDNAAIAFSTGFYQALGYGKNYEEAFEWGKSAIQLRIDDDSKNRDTFAEETRKFIAVGSVSETIITQEYLKPVMKINLDTAIKEEINMTYLEIDYEEINQAFLDAYRNYPELERMLKFKLGKNLPEIVSRTQPMTEVIYSLINWAESNGAIQIVIKGAYTNKSNNQKIKQIYDKYIN